MPLMRIQQLILINGHVVKKQGLFDGLVWGSSWKPVSLTVHQIKQLLSYLNNWTICPKLQSDERLKWRSHLHTRPLHWRVTWTTVPGRCDKSLWQWQHVSALPWKPLSHVKCLSFVLPRSFHYTTGSHSSNSHGLHATNKRYLGTEVHANSDFFCYGFT